MSGTLIVAILGFAISLGLAAIKVWETFLAKPRLDVSFVWFDALSYLLELHITVGNLGYRPDSVRSITLVAENGMRYYDRDVAALLPVLLQPGEVAQFAVKVRTDDASYPATSLFVGKGKVRITDARGRVKELDVPGTYDVPRDEILAASELLPPPDPAEFPDG